MPDISSKSKQIYPGLVLGSSWPSEQNLQKST